MKKTFRKQTSTFLVFVALTAAITSILSQIALPSPTGVPMTLQTFAFALIGYILFSKHAFYSILLYLLLGAVGLPVFANFRGGFMHLAGLTGGLIARRAVIGVFHFIQELRHLGRIGHLALSQLLGQFLILVMLACDIGQKLRATSDHAECQGNVQGHHHDDHRHLTGGPHQLLAV